MHEGLQLQLRRGALPQFADLCQGHLPAQHHAGRAHVVVGAGGGVVQAVGLGAHVNLQLRRGQPQRADQAQVGHDRRVHAQRMQRASVIGGGVHVGVAREGVDRDVDALPGGVHRLYGLRQGLHVEAHAPGAQLEHRPADVHRVRTEAQRGGKALGIARRGKQLKGMVGWNHLLSPFSSRRPMFTPAPSIFAFRYFSQQALE